MRNIFPMGLRPLLFGMSITLFSLTLVIFFASQQQIMFFSNISQTFQHSNYYDHQLFHQSDDNKFPFSKYLSSEYRAEPEIAYEFEVHNLLELSVSTDSSGLAVYIKGNYSDDTKFKYPICTFERVCISNSHVLFTISDLKLWVYYSYLLSNCHHRPLWDNTILCSCFHYAYKGGLLPYPFKYTKEDKDKATIDAIQMLKDRYSNQGVDWDNAQTEESHPIIEELINISTILSNQDLSSTRLYPYPFSSSIASPSKVTSQPLPPVLTPPIIYHYHPIHYWSIQKWVEQHHIGHWTQKLLIMHATISHWEHVCKQNPHININTNHGTDNFHSNQKLFPLLEKIEQREAGADFRLPCHFPISGVLFHDSSLPLTEHESFILNVTIDSIQEWRKDIQEEYEARRKIIPSSWEYWSDWMSHLYSSFFLSTLPSSFTTKSADTSPSVSDTGDFLSHLSFREDLYQWHHPDILADRMKQNMNLPIYRNVYSLGCFRRISFSPMYGNLVDNSYDFHFWRKNAQEKVKGSHKHAHKYNNIPIRPIQKQLIDIHQPNQLKNGIPSISSYSSSSSVDVPVEVLVRSALEWSECPPPRAILITRPDRLILNRDDLFREMINRFNLYIDEVTIDRDTPSLEQVLLFSSSGLILASHSSQLTNIIFSPIGSAIIEITPEFYNKDFSLISSNVGIYFRYALGGIIDNPILPYDPLISNCNEQLFSCDGDNYCIISRLSSCKQQQFPNKNRPFSANLTAVEIAVRQALEHISWSCYGRWKNIKLNQWEE